MSRWPRADRLLDALCEVLVHKDLDKLWPIGFPTACHRYGVDLAYALSSALPLVGQGRAGAHLVCGYPTSLVILAAGLVYPARELGWTMNEVGPIMEGILAAAERAKGDDPLNGDGNNRILREEELAAFRDGGGQSVSWFREETDIRSVCHLSALLFAYAECLFFCNHRLGTEKHGPYTLGEDGTILLVRSATNLDGASLWRDVPLHTPRIASQIELAFVCRPFEIHFDAFSNPVSTTPFPEAVLKAGFRSANKGEVRALTPLDAIGALTESLYSDITLLARRIRSMSASDRAERLAKVQLRAATPILRAAGQEPSAVWKRMLLSADSSRTCAPYPENRAEQIRYHDLRTPLLRG
jgi:hypothetical protein